MKLVLASASPRRRELIRLIEPETICITSPTDENVPCGLSKADIPAYLACRKAAAVAKDYPNVPVIGADTLILLDDTFLGKPKDKADAVRMLSMLSGRTHTVITGCCVVFNGKRTAFSCATKVTFWPLDEKTIHDYVATGEPMDKAGSYGIQGKGALLVESIEGDYNNVVGLPVSLLNKKLSELLSGKD